MGSFSDGFKISHSEVPQHKQKKDQDLKAFKTARVIELQTIYQTIQQSTLFRDMCLQGRVGALMYIHYVLIYTQAYICTLYMYMILCDVYVIFLDYVYIHRIANSVENLRRSNNTNTQDSEVLGTEPSFILLHYLIKRYILAKWLGSAL